jgi:hypothetical protein
LTATGGDGRHYTWSVAAGSLPPGLSIRTDVPDCLYVSAIDIATPGVLPNATQFGAYSATVTATGGSGIYTFRIDSLPPGLVSDTSGSISGLVTAEPGKWGL